MKGYNNFKKNPGFGASVTNSNGDAIVGLKVLFKAAGKKVGSAVTDENSVYVFTCKWAGKATAHEIWINGAKVESGSLKASGFMLSEFIR